MIFKVMQEPKINEVLLKLNISHIKKKIKSY